MNRQEQAAQQEAAAALHEQLRWLEGRFDSMGPWVMGAEFSLVDASLLPFFLRLPVLQHYRGFGLPEVHLPIRETHRNLLTKHRAAVPMALHAFPNLAKTS